MVELCFATNNQYKIEEISQMLGKAFKILSLKDIGCTEELPENQSTLEGNSMEKARYVFEKYNHACFADDTGLEVDALNGNPGVLSARYAGDQKNSDDNIKLLLKNLKGVSSRSAKFRTVITLITSNGTHQFEGKVDGYILNEKRGYHGFGYDPVFIPEGFKNTFAELTLDRKNAISHRGRAFRKLVDHLRNQSNY
jgi:XTP/dITP diphosphohydrolase